MQKSIFRKKFKKVCVLQRQACTNSKFQTQLSRKLQRFKTCRKNKKCSIFHDLSEHTLTGEGYDTLPPLIHHARGSTITQNFSALRVMVKLDITQKFRHKT